MTIVPISEANEARTIIEELRAFQELYDMDLLMSCLLTTFVDICKRGRASDAEILHLVTDTLRLYQCKVN